MDDFYRGVETSLLAMSLALILAVLAVSRLPGSPAMPGGIETTLPMISVPGDADGE